MPTLHVLNGPNLDRLGKREPEVYGRTTLPEVEAMCRKAAEHHGCELVFRQTNSQPEMIGFLHEAADHADGVAINPAGFGYHAVPVLDAVKMLACPVVEVHISNVHRRDEAWRANTLLTGSVTGIISGLGVEGYELAVEWLARKVAIR